ncbi:hypothetical protein N9O88_00215 [bacterium]|nr:hypothetical protein [bacterium]
MENNFTDNIKDWVSTDNKIKNLSLEIKQLRDRKNILTTDIFNKVKEDNLHNSCINISDGKLRFSLTNQSQSLTLKYIENCLKKCIDNEDDIKHIIDIIKSNREIKQIDDIKRTYNN